MTREAMTREEHRTLVLDSVRRQREHMEPDGDWMAMLLIDGGRVVIVIDAEVLPLTFDPKLHGILTEIMRRAGGEHFARVLSVWMTDPPANGEMPTEPGYARNAADRRELVVVMLGDAEHIEVVAAELTRTPDAPPELGAFNVMTASPSA